MKRKRWVRIRARRSLAVSIDVTLIRTSSLRAVKDLVDLGRWRRTRFGEDIGGVLMPCDLSELSGRAPWVCLLPKACLAAGVESQEVENEMQDRDRGSYR